MPIRLPGAAQQRMRHELKYIISTGGARYLQHELSRTMDTDPHAGPDGSYFIRSLYFDDVHFTAYRDKLNGVEKRAKYRLRYYNFDPGFLVLEKKEKLRDMTRKTSVRVTQEEALAMLREGRVPETDIPLLQEFDALWREGLRPCVLVDYDRHVFAHCVGNTRITLDRNVRTSPCKTELFDRGLAMMPVLGEGQVILEVKYDDQFPTHAGYLLDDLPRERLAVSKFCRCLSILE